jgi:hypothetical protein
MLTYTDQHGGVSASCLGTAWHSLKYLDPFQRAHGPSYFLSRIGYLSRQLSTNELVYVTL